MDEEQEEQKKTHLIPTSSFVVMLVIMAACDGISFLLGLLLVAFAETVILSVIFSIVNDVFVFIVNMGIWFWTARHGMGLKGAIGGGAGMVIEIVPGLNMLPTFTALVIALYIASRVKEKIPLPAAAKLASKI